MVATKEFRYLDYDYGMRLPRLVLACSDPSLPILEGERSWLKIAHQTAGFACNQHHLLGTVLDPRVKVGEAMCVLDKKWEGSCVGMYGATLDQVLAYREDLGEIFKAGLDCNFAFQELEEGFYPIDLTPQVLKRLAYDQLPKHLDELVDWDSMPGNPSLNKVFGSLNRWGLYILGNNCD